MVSHMHLLSLLAEITSSPSALGACPISGNLHNHPLMVLTFTLQKTAPLATKGDPNSTDRAHNALVSQFWNGVSAGAGCWEVALCAVQPQASSLPRPMCAMAKGRDQCRKRRLHRHKQLSPTGHVASVRSSGFSAKTEPGSCVCDPSSNLRQFAGRIPCS